MHVADLSEAVMQCAWETLRAGSVCIYGCGTTLRRDYDEPPDHTCKSVRKVGDFVQPKPSQRPAVQPTQPAGWGDQLAEVLGSVGITKDRYVEVKARFGLPPTCSCDARQEWLNCVSAWWRGEG